MDEIRTIQKKSLVKKVTSPQELCSTKLKETLKTLKTGANDVVVVQQSDGLTYKATPLYIRYNKFIHTSILNHHSGISSSALKGKAMNSLKFERVVNIVF